MLLEHQKIDKLLTKGIKDRVRQVNEHLDENFIIIVHKLKNVLIPII